VTTALKARESDGKDSGMATGLLGLAAYCCAGYRLEELGKAVAKWGKHFAEKWCFTKRSTCDNFQLKDCL